MPSYTVPINGPNGPGFMTVNASSPSEAQNNANQGGNYATGQAQEGGHQAHTGTGGEAVAGYPAGYGPSGPIGAPPTQTSSSNDAEVQKLGQQINRLMGAISSGNKEAFDEAVRQFNLSFGLDTSKFAEGVRQFNENLAIAQSGVTGTFQGTPTQQAIAQRAGLGAQYAQIYGNAPTFDAQGQLVFQPGETLAANQQRFAQQFGAIQAAAALQTNPFRQAQAMGQFHRLLGGQGVAGFQAPGPVQG